MLMTAWVTCDTIAAVVVARFCPRLRRVTSRSMTAEAVFGMKVRTSRPMISRSHAEKFLNGDRNRHTRQC